MRIETYKFGEMVIDGKSYKKDVIIYPDRVFSPWWRQSGHRLIREDLEDIFSYDPHTVVIGTGKFGMMKVEDALLAEFEKRHIETLILKTDTAVDKYNELNSTRIIGAFHLTC